MTEKTYIAVDLKSFYASVECVERGLDPLKTNLVVADQSRTEKTICLAVSPALKAYGIPGRARLFEVIQKVNEVNHERLSHAPNHTFSGESYNCDELLSSPELSLSYITAVPRMAYYIEYSTRIYQVYLKYFSAEDIHVYSIDEVFIDITSYMNIYKLTARELTVKIIYDILETTGITATAGIGTNLYLAKVAMDIGAKHIKPDKNGVRIAELDEMSYRYTLWDHRPITDFWRVGRGYANKLAGIGLFTMGDVAKCSVGKPDEYYNEDLLYKLFGVNAELLIDHAWGYEPCTISAIKSYKPSAKSISSGQVLHCPYNYEKTKIVISEMADSLALDLAEKSLVTNKLVLTISYDIKNVDSQGNTLFDDIEITTDRYGRKKPKHAHGTISLSSYTSSSKEIITASLDLFDRIINKNLFTRKINITAVDIIDSSAAKVKQKPIQLDIFTDFAALEAKQKEENISLEREKKIQKAIINIKKKYGKNAVLKGTNFREGATAMDRNSQIGGHKA